MKPDTQRTADLLVKAREKKRLLPPAVACHIKRVATCTVSVASGCTEGSS